MALDAYLYGNPETILERKQEHLARQLRACGQCVHHRTIEFKGEVLHGCDCRNRTYGKRCQLFEIKKG
ncbi:hypothetical protein [Rhodoferax sp. GW822-FHT02A01]|uniref:hypothetical protein n=1 Tax=Rhodoferax sp. GW822-FHT02A01 TaxID=3141537 RepID=UPI00315DED5B